MPSIGIDGSPWIVAALSNPSPDSKVSSQFHAHPAVPVTEVLQYIMTHCSILMKAKFIPIFVFDGQRFPLKIEENDARRDGKDLDALYTALHEAYLSPTDFTINDTFQLRRKTMYPREDILYEVGHGLQRNGIRVVCAAFEADSELIEMENQGIIDAAISIDTDLIGQRMRYTIKKLTLKGDIELMDLIKLLATVLPKHLNDGLTEQSPVAAITLDDLRFFCCMLGTDYLRKGLPGSGPVDCIKCMRNYVSCETAESKQDYINRYQNDHVNTTSFRQCLFAWKHAPAFLIESTEDGVLAKEAYFSGNYRVILGSMSGCTDQCSSLFYQPTENKLGFLPEIELRKGHPSPNENNKQPSFCDFFQMRHWSRTGLALYPVTEQKNRQGQVVVFGAIIDFEFTLLRHQPTRCLKLWLSGRGVSTSDIKDREQLEDMVHQIDRMETDALPKFVMRGGGEYVANAIFEPKNGTNLEWRRNDDAIAAIRSNSCEGYETPATVDSFFTGQYNSKRLRCLSHLKSGSIDIKDINVTADLVSDLMPRRSFFVIQCSCAPSMKGLGSEGKLYSLRIAFLVNDDGPNTLMPAPFSFCECPVGVGPCAHKGGLVLVLFIIRNCFRTLNNDDLTRRMPANIYSVANQCHLVHHIFPAQYSAEYMIQRQIKTNVKASSRRRNLDGNESEVDDLHLEVVNETEGSLGVPLINICDIVGEWCMTVTQSIRSQGVGHLSTPRLSHQACEAAASPETDVQNLKRRDLRAILENKAVEDNLLPATMHGYWCKHYVRNQLRGHVGNLDDLVQYISYPDKTVYPPGVEDDDVDSRFSGDFMEDEWQG